MRRFIVKSCVGGRIELLLELTNWRTLCQFEKTVFYIIAEKINVDKKFYFDTKPDCSPHTPLVLTNLYFPHNLINHPGWTKLFSIEPNHVVQSTLGS